MSGSGRAARGAFLAVLAVCVVVAVGWLAVGAYVAIVRYWPGALEAAEAAGAAGSRWSAAVAAAAPASEPLDQAVLDYALSLANLVIAVILLLLGGRAWSLRLLALAMVGSAGAFNLQAHAAAAAVQAATGFGVGSLHQIVLHGIASAAYILALLVFPAPADSAWWDARPGARSSRFGLAVVGVGVLVVVGVGTALLRHTASCVLFFGFLVPLTGVVVLPRRIKAGRTAELRTQARLVFSLLVAASAGVVVLGISTLLLWELGVPGLTLYDPTAHGGGGNEPLALLFWSSRLAAAAIAVAMLVALRADRLWTAERVFSRGLAAALAIALVGGGVVCVQAVATEAGLGTLGSLLPAAVLAALAFLPVYTTVEGLTDRLLFGRRPTPYRALADVAALSRTTSHAPDLARVAEAVGEALGATTCRLTVVRPGLRDRTYAWSASGVPAGEQGDLVAVPVRSGERRIGTLAVDRAAVAGLHAERRHLLEDIADSLGAVVDASRLGIELERQLRAALAHAAGIAGSRRQAVSEMDQERRRIERDLHDGAQHQLVSLRLVLGMVEHEVENGRLSQAAERLGVLAGQLDTAEAVLAETASGVRSMALAERGLVAALEAELTGPHATVRIESGLDPDRRFPIELESAVYFCCLESVNNAHKHAPGAGIVVRFDETCGRLQFTVRDEGPGFELPAPNQVGPRAASAGRGLRNLAARIVAVGGVVDIRSAPGQGTVVEGSVPVPAAELGAAIAAEAFTPVGAARPLEVPAAPDHRAPDRHRPDLDEATEAVRAVVAEPSPGPPPAVDEPDVRTLHGQVRAVVAEARGGVTAAVPAARLAAVAERLDGPVRIGVDGPPGVGVSTLVRALTRAVEPIAGAVVAEGTVDADAVVLLLDGTPVDTGAAPAVGVLPRADEAGTDPWREVERLLADPGVRRACHTVVPVSGLLALAGAGLDDADLAELRDGTATGRSLADRLGATGLQLAVEHVRAGASTEALRVELVRRSGVPRLRELLAVEVGGRADVLRVRAALRELEEIAGELPAAAPSAENLRYQLDRIRSGAHELAEADLVDALRAGRPALSDEDRAAAEKLLGMAGDLPAARLGLPDGAGADDVRLAAAAQLSRWRLRASQPLATKDFRDAAAVLVRTCEHLVSATPATEPAPPGDPVRRAGAQA
ncbi:ATP-binding protein [Pseudonocardia sp.]|uniref:ATP-binding protein n=1 Tax=Pseudonocardia sp. TaxID=60912 RepID=UPI0031FCA8F7